MIGQNEVMFDGGIPMLEGTWYNPKTGDSLTIRDTLFEDNNLVVLTTDGRRVPYTQMEKYVKSDKPIPKMPKVDPNITKKKKQQPSKRDEALAEPATWDDLILDEDKDVLGGDTNPLLKGLNNIPKKKKEEPKSVDDQILEKALKRWDNDIKVDVSIQWGAKESTLNNLMDMFGFTEEDFAKYLLSKVKNIDLEEPMKEAIKKIIK